MPTSDLKYSVTVLARPHSFGWSCCVLACLLAKWRYVAMFADHMAWSCYRYLKLNFVVGLRPLSLLLLPLLSLWLLLNYLQSCALKCDSLAIIVPHTPRVTLPLSAPSGCSVRLSVYIISGLKSFNQLATVTVAVGIVDVVVDDFVNFYIAGFIYECMCGVSQFLFDNIPIRVPVYVGVWVGQCWQNDNIFLCARVWYYEH